MKRINAENWTSARRYFALGGCLDAQRGSRPANNTSWAAFKSVSWLSKTGRIIGSPSKAINPPRRKTANTGFPLAALADRARREVDGYPAETVTRITSCVPAQLSAGRWLELNQQYGALKAASTPQIPKPNPSSSPMFQSFNPSTFARTQKSTFDNSAPCRFFRVALADAVR
jgi:hypothetical protein